MVKEIITKNPDLRPQLISLCTKQLAASTVASYNWIVKVTYSSIAMRYYFIIIFTYLEKLYNLLYFMAIELKNFLFLSDLPAIL